MSRMLHRTKRGFTLVELLIVIIIIAVLAAVAIPKFANSSQRSKESALKAELKLMRNAVELFKNDTGAFPAAIGDLATATPPATGKSAGGADLTINAADFRGPYLTAISTDPTNGAAFSYTAAGGVVKSNNNATGTDGTAYNTW